jgi:site-specific recombinase XerD
MALALVPVHSSLDPIRALVLDAVSSPLTRAMYGRALEDFFAWRQCQGEPRFTRALVQAHRAHLEAEGYAPASINQRLSAIRKLAAEAAANGLLDFETAASIQQVPGAKQRGVRMGNWLTPKQAQQLLDAPAGDTIKGLRDRAALGLLIGCGLRRSEAAAVTLEHVQMREGRWLIMDMSGKGGRIRTVPVPSGVKVRIDRWCEAAGIANGRILRSLNRGVLGERMSGQAILDLVAEYAHIKPHDLRRTCAKLCRKAGGELEQIQMLLGHASIATTERYLGSEQDIEHAPNDRLPLTFM